MKQEFKFFTMIEIKAKDAIEACKKVVKAVKAFEKISILSQIETQKIADNECKKEVCKTQNHSKELEYCSYCGKSGCNGNCY